MKRGFFIPADIWEDQGLTLQEKVILAEIVSFHKDGKECYVSNEVFGKMICASPWTASMAVSSLTEKGLIKRTGFDGKKRFLALCETQSQPCENPKATRVKNKKQTCKKQKAAFGKSQDIIPTDTTYPSVESTNKNYNNDAKDFVPPTVAQVYDYVKDKGMKDPMGFAYYYVKTQTANGWTRRQGNKLVPVLNWKNNVNQWMPNHMNHVFPKPEIQQTPTFAERVYGPSDLSEITTLVPLDVEKHIRAGGWARFTNNTWTKI